MVERFFTFEGIYSDFFHEFFERIHTKIEVNIDRRFIVFIRLIMQNSTFLDKFKEYVTVRMAKS